MSQRTAGRFGRLAALLGVLGTLTACMDRDPVTPMQVGEAQFDVTSQQWDGEVRVGMVTSATSITIGSEGDFVVRSVPTGEVLLSGSDGNVQVTIENRPIIGTFWWLQVVYTANEAYIADWVERAEALGYETMLEQHPSLPGKRLLLGKWPASESFGSRVAIKDLAVAQGLAAADAFWRSISTSQQGEVRVSHGGVSVVAPAPVILESDALVRINTARYRGSAMVGFNSTGNLAGINKLPIEEYLYGVVPRELPPVPYGEMEALKAQSVAARTYTLRNLNKRGSDGYDLLPTTSDQVYGGYAAEHPLSTQAVDETAGIVVRYGNAFAETLYFSTSGGFTANNEDVYNSSPVLYLRGKPDAERGQALENVPSLDVFKRRGNPTNLRAAGNGDFEADWSIYHRWVVEWTNEEMNRALTSSFGTTVTQVDAIRVTDRADHGRVLRIEFETDAGVLVETKDRIRTRLPYVTASGSLASLRSTLFYIEPVTDSRTKEVTGWKAYGGGWGHGVGMSQTGAVGMAEKGRTYQQILHHYYTGVDLVQWY
jgi:stage II sporulation protein D